MKKPLEGIKVLDLTRYMAGPFCAMILADLGADVIKIEAPWGELSRARPPLIGGVSPSFMYFHRNKKGMTLNLKSEKGVQIFKDLVKKSDVVIENYSLGVMDRLGIGYKTLREINPKIIFASITGFGQYGPLSSRHSYDIVAQAMSGLMAMNGERADPDGPPVLVPGAPGDSVPALINTISILAALNYRNLTGQGQRIDISQRDSLVYILGGHLSSYLLTGFTREELREKYADQLKGTPGIYDMFSAKDGYFVIAATMGPIYDRLTTALGREEVDKEFFEEWAKEKTISEIESVLVKARIPVAPVIGIDKVVVEPQLLAREMIMEINHPKAGKIKMVGIPMKFSETPLKVESPAPLLGQNNEEILSEFLGYNEDEISELKKEGVI